MAKESCPRELCVNHGDCEEYRVWLEVAQEQCTTLANTTDTNVPARGQGKANRKLSTATSNLEYKAKRDRCAQLALESVEGGIA
jgi:hypothetical protein